jgi:hypothetical protein
MSRLLAAMIHRAELSAVFALGCILEDRARLIV